MRVWSLGWEDPLEKGQPTPYACWQNPMDRGAWSLMGYSRGVAKSWTWLSTHTENISLYCICTISFQVSHLLTGTWIVSMPSLAIVNSAAMNIWVHFFSLGIYTRVKLLDYMVFLSMCSVASVVSDSSQPLGLRPTRLLCPWDFPDKNTRVSCHSLLQGIFLTQRLNLCLLHLLHCRGIIYPLTIFPLTV